MTTATLMIEKIETLNGFSEIKLGEIQIIKNYDIILHIIDPYQIKNVISALESNIADLNLIEEKGILSTELESLKHMTQTIIPHRHRRGLLNIVGTGFKWLYGTMDDDDRQNIEEHLKVIDENNHNVMINSNKQVHVKDYFNKTFLTLKDAIEKDRIQITEQLNIVNEGNKKILSKLVYLETLLKIKIIKDNLEHIQNNIASSRLGTMGNNILTTDEISKYDIDFDKLQNIKLGTLKYEEDKIIFAIKIPKETFKTKLYFITAMPNQDFEELLIEEQKIVKINNVTYKYTEDQDYKNLKQFNLCHELKCIKSKNIKALLNEIEKGLLLVKNQVNVSLSSNCDERKQNLNGNYLLTFSNCEIYLNNNTFRNKEERFQQRFVIPDTTKLKVNQTKLTFDDLLIKQVENTEFIKELKFQKQSHLFINIGMSLVIVIVLLMASIFVYLKVRKLYKIQGNFSLKGGDVMSKPKEDLPFHHGSTNFPIDWLK